MKRLREFLDDPLDYIVVSLTWFFKRVLLILVLAAMIIVGREILFLLNDLSGTGFAGKTLWDWLSLLIVPVFLLIGGVLINFSIQRREREQTDKRAEVDQQIADDRLKEQALQTYLDRMSELLLDGRFDNPETKEKAKIVARAWTLTVLRGLDDNRKASLLRFLYEANLSKNDGTPINLEGADLSNSNLAWAFLNVANLAYVKLTGANLCYSFLVGANLRGTQFDGANLQWAFLQQANLQGASFKGANLKGAEFENADLQGANFWNANLKDAKITPEQLAVTLRNEGTTLPDGSHPKTTLP